MSPGVCGVTVSISNLEPGPGPVLPVHVVRDPGTPSATIIIIELRRVETLDEDGSDVEMLFRN
eukprot:12015094-Alexandrium_andersonii.AAC.1